MRLLAASVVLLAACSSDRPDADAEANIATETAPATAPAPGAEPVLRASADGLSSELQTVKFGAPLATAIALTESLGGHDDQPQQLDDCSAGPLLTVRVGDLLLLGEGEKFVGWHISDSAELRFRTDKGVTVGTSLRDLKRAYDIEVFESTVGTEFTSTDGIGGLLSDASQSAKVAHLWAGTTCIMR
jgi:hypothetical protein